MANGFPGGNFRIVNKETGACISSQHGGQSYGEHDGVTARGETGKLAYSHTNDRLFTVNDKVKNIEEELWYFESRVYNGGHRENKLYNKVSDIRSSWVLGASVKNISDTYKLLDKDLETFLSLLPEQDEETLAHLRTSDFLDITALLSEFIYVNGEKTIKSELIGKLDETKLNDSLNTALAYNSIRSIEQKFRESAHSSSSGLNIPRFEDSIDTEFTPPNEQLYKIILAYIKLDILIRQNYSSHLRNLRLDLNYEDIKKVLENLKKEKLEEIQSQVWAEYNNVEAPQKEAVKIILELKKTLDLHTDEENIDTVKKILQTGLQSNESFEQLQTALNSTYGKELQSVKMYSGHVFLQGSGREHQTNWAFEDGYIFVEGQPDAVLTHSWGPYASISHRSDDPKQRWELK